MGEPAVSPTYCPINGAYTFTYSVNDGTENSLECQQHTSEISDCPYGFGLNLKFKGCSFGNMDMSFHCLGDWEGPSPNQRYVALMDTHERAGDVSTRPIYRCAVSHSSRLIVLMPNCRLGYWKSIPNEIGNLILTCNVSYFAAL